MIDYVVFGGIRPHVGQTEADRRQIRFCVDLNKAPDVTEEPNAEDESPLEVDDRKPDGVPFSGTSENRGSTDSIATSTALSQSETVKGGENSDVG